MGSILDAQLFHWLYEWLHQPFLYPVMNGLTHLGDSKTVLILALVGILESAFVSLRRRRRTLLMPWAGIPMAALVTNWLKGLVGRPRPAEGIPGLEVISSEAGRSFPSGHATLAFALACALSIRWPGGRGVWFGLATGVALSRLALGMHWLSDVVAGALIGWGVVTILAWAERKFRSNKGPVI